MRAWVLLLALVACGGPSHVRLPSPRPGITPSERVQMFWQHRATAQMMGTTDAAWTNQTLVLGDSRTGAPSIEIEAPEDLEPLVGPDSETMRHARRSVVARDSSRRWKQIAVAVLATGLIAAVLLERRNELGGSSSGEYVFYAGALAAALPAGLSYRAAGEELVWRKRAFSTYTRDLGLYLDVCAHGMQVVPCAPGGEGAPGATVPSARLQMRDGAASL